jgi:transposase
LTYEEINDMASIALSPVSIVVGVDTHKDEHVAVALDELGTRLGEYFAPATPDGYGALLEWAAKLGTVRVFGVEGCGSYGCGLYRFLRRHDYNVIEVNRPARRGERRLSGKSDVIDAEHAAREVLAGRARSIPKTSNGSIESIRLVRIARNTAVKAQTTAMITLKATLVTATDDLRSALEALTDYRLIVACAALVTEGDLVDPCAAMRYTLACLAKRWLSIHEEVKIHSRHLKRLTLETAPALVEAFGIGPDIAGELLCAAGDNTDRIRSEAAFAKLCGVSPIPASSGRTTGRYRLNRGGNRQANAALYRAVIVRMRWHEPTITYVKKRTADGLTKKDIIRCLKRYVAREVYGLLPPPAATEIAPSTA